MKSYRIAAWEARFETSETRKLKHLDWWPKPNKHDGLGFRRIAAHPKKIELYCAWNLICDIASKSPKDKRGLLERDGKPLTAEDLSLMTGFPVEIFEEALTFFSDKKQGWLICDKSDTSDESPEKTAEPAAKTAPSPAEGKGREEKGIELFPPASPPGDLHQTFIKGWCDSYEKAWGMKYAVDGGRDGKAVKELLRMGIVIVDLLEIAKSAWAKSRTGSFFNCKQAASIHGFKTRFNEIRAELKTGGSSKPTPSEQRNSTIMGDHDAHTARLAEIIKQETGASL